MCHRLWVLFGEGAGRADMFNILELRWPGDSQCESGQFARINSQKKLCHDRSSDSRESPEACDFATFSAPRRDSQKRGSVREPCNDLGESCDSQICESIRANRANLRY